MAESQEPIAYDGVLLLALTDALSRPRLAPYLSIARGDRVLGIRHYLWNSRLAKSFLFPLNVAEVTTRNSMQRALSTEFSSHWIIHPPFRLTPESETSRRKALARLNGNATPDDLVAALTFDFWSNLFRRDYKSLWDRPGLLHRTFPNLPAGLDRSHVQLLVAEINHFRNRIAHHEPIHSLDHRALLESILTLIGYRSTDARQWVRKCSTVMTVVRTPPKAGSTLPGLPLSSTNLRPPLLLTGETPILEALSKLGNARPAVALILGENAPDWAILTANQLMSYVAAQAAKDQGLIDLAEHRVCDILEWAPPVVSASIERSASTGDALAAFFPADTPQNARPQVLLVTSNKRVIGVLGHPITRYV